MHELPSHGLRRVVTYCRMGEEPHKLKLIIAGGRNYCLGAFEFAWLDHIDSDIGVTAVVSGGAPGADAGGEEWAKARGKTLIRMPADWERLGRSAGPKRNENMALFAGACALFPGGKGTADMRRRAVVHGLQIFDFAPTV